ncbi:MAG: DUF1573 domain-containing protein [Planctomycetota bacterium]|nr:DUF1573 domain-containing protein [Planctomycetota bacterium]
MYQTSPTSTDGVVIGPVYSSDPSSSTPMVGVVAWDPLNPVAAESGVAPAGGSLVSSSPNYPVLPASTQSVITAQAGVTGLGGGYQLRPATDIPPGNHPSDAAPSQWFEIIRPGGAPLRIGRVTSACVCVGVRVPKRVIGQGERALIELRAVAKPPRWGLEYAFFVNVAEPVKETLEAGVAFNG